MKPQKPDRFERIVRKEERQDHWGIDVVSAEDVIKLFRKEHAWMRRMVKNRIGLYQMSEPTMNALNGILDELDQRRK